MKKTMMIQLLSIIADYPATYDVLVRCYTTLPACIGTWYSDAAEALTNIEEKVMPNDARYFLEGVYQSPGTALEDY